MFFGDLTFTFHENGQYQAVMAGKNEAGTWVLDGPGKVITLTNEKGQSDEAEIVNLTENKLVLRVGKGTFILGRAG